jgi:hypothetical protein
MNKKIGVQRDASTAMKDSAIPAINVKIRVARYFTAGLLLLLYSFSLKAGVSPEQAARLGAELTPMGAVREANAEGTIPPWSGHILGAPDWVEYAGSGTHFPDPYPDEKPLFEITHANYLQYKKNLTDGQLELFRKYPSFRMPVYQSKRDFRYSDKFHDNVKENAVSAYLIPSGSGFRGAFFGTPFPLPANGLQLIWNHQASPSYSDTDGVLDTIVVFPGGGLSLQQTREERHILYFDEEMSRDEFNQQPYAAQVMVHVYQPLRNKGTIVLVHEFRDVTEVSRNAWAYLPGTRRVRRAPSINYDFPNGPSGLRTIDDALLFNGATDRYTWKMEPVRELYIPYNTHKLDDPARRYEDFMTPYHLDPSIMRYELHRCWVVVAELKSDKRHIYGKRRLYLDEDTWAGVLSDNYDNKGYLWRTSMRTMLPLYDLPGMGPRVEIYHDFQKDAYGANYLVNELSGPPKRNEKGWNANYFTTQMVRKLGKR